MLYILQWDDNLYATLSRSGWHSNTASLEIVLCAQFPIKDNTLKGRNGLAYRAGIALGAVVLDLYGLSAAQEQELKGVIDGKSLSSLFSEWRRSPYSAWGNGR